MREKSEFKKNFNGEDIKPGEVMIPFEYTELDDENCTNRECIKTLTVGGRNFKVIYKAVPEEWAKKGTSATGTLTGVQSQSASSQTVSTAMVQTTVQTSLYQKQATTSSSSTTSLVTTV